MNGESTTMTDSKVISMTSPTQRAGTSTWEIKRRFDDIFLEHYPRIHGFLTRLLGDHAEAEDLALETFLRLYDQSENLNQKDFNVAGWLHRVSHNLGLNAIRSRKRRQQYELASGMQTLLSTAADSPAEAYDVEEARQSLRQVLAQMPLRQSQLLVMRYSGLSYQEIATVLGVSPTSSGPLLARAEAEFEKRYRSTMEEGG